MRKGTTFGLAVVLVASLVAAALPAPIAQAQDGGALPLGEWVEGELTQTACTASYTVQASKGDLILVEFVRSMGTMDLDPAMVITDSVGTIVLIADDTVSGLGAAAILESTGDAYTITGMPSSLYYNQADTTAPLASWDLTCPTDATYGKYMVRASMPELLVPGSSVTSTIYADYAKDASSVYVIRPDAPVTWAFSFEQPGNDLRAGIELMKMPDEETVFALEDTMGVRSGTLNVDLEAGQIYFLVVNKSPYAFLFDDTATIDVTISISEAQ
ncbi:MAG TPA: hypothetical protein VHP83_11680 [Aggregatilineaceae bacterium]|nr:hypothetical protein [Aggregatilineaceae bacterium]